MRKIVSIILVLSIMFSLFAVTGAASAASASKKATVVLKATDLGTSKEMTNVTFTLKCAKTGETKTVKASKTGKYKVSLTPGTWTATVSVPKGYNKPSSKKFTVKAGDAVTKAFKVYPVFKVKVTVVNAKGKPVSGATVQICGNSATTNSKGVATVKGVEYGKNNVQVSISKNNSVFITYAKSHSLKGKANSTITLKITQKAEKDWAQLFSFAPPCRKPIIYLYSKTEQDVNVKLGNPDVLTASYPKYPENGWNVTVHTDGSLTYKDTGRDLYSLYWEGTNTEKSIQETGFVIPGADTAAFLEEKLAYLGLNELEAEEFIMYWLPQMQKNPYNYIRFATAEEIEEVMPLTIEPAAEKVIRVWMEYTPLEEDNEIPEQELVQVDRSALEELGFYAVEWGGTDF